MPLELEGRMAVAFGGSSGLGVELCKHLLRHGVSKLAILDLHAPPPATFDAQFEERVIWFECDFFDVNQIPALIEREVVPQLGRIDIFVNSVEDFSDLDPARSYAINLTSVMSSCATAMDLMSREAGGNGGVIVNVASIAGLDPTPALSIYASVMSAVVTFTHDMGRFVGAGESGVKFMTICAGVTETTQLARVLAGDHALFPWMHGADLEGLLRIYPPQSPSVVGQCLIDALLAGQNGAVWTSMFGINNRIEFPEYLAVNLPEPDPDR